MTTFCGNAASTGHVDGLANSARFSNPESVCFDAHDGSLYVSDTDNHRIRRIAPDLRMSTRAGDGQGRHLDGHATAASFENPPRGGGALPFSIYDEKQLDLTSRCFDNPSLNYTAKDQLSGPDSSDTAVRRLVQDAESGRTEARACSVSI